jgi:hypothetical protein
MKNLKKVLSLALALMMVLGITLTASAAPVSDVELIENRDAFDLLSGLEIMQGHANGSFEPKGNLTRAQAAKMIYVARTGGIDDKAEMFKGTNMFSDVASSHWADGYINYAASKGFVVGRLNGTFDPEGLISGYELMKILLCAIGYDSKVSHFENDAKWQVNVITVAKESGLLENYKGNPAAAITRDEAALIMANMIYMNTVSYNTNGNLVSGNTFAKTYLGLESVSGVLVSNENAAIEGALCAAGKSRIRVGENVVTVPVSSSVDMLGYNVTALLRVKANQVLADENGVYNENAIARAYGNLTQTSGKNKVIALDAKAVADANAKYFINFKAAEKADVDELGLGQSVVAISNNGDDKYDVVIALKYSAGTVSSVANNGNLYIGGISMNKDNAVGIEGLAKGDYVRYYLIENGKYVVEKAEIITAVAGGFTAKYIQLNNVNYFPATGITGFTTVDTNLVSETNFFVFGSFIYKAETNAVVSTAYAYVTKSTVVGWEHQVNAVLDDGEQKTFVAANGADLIKASATATVNPGLYTYVKTDEGQLKLKVVDDIGVDRDSNLSYENGKTKIDGDALYVNSKTVLFLEVDGKWVVYKGMSNIPTFTAKADGENEIKIYSATGDLFGTDDLLAVMVVPGAVPVDAVAKTHFVVMSDVVKIAGGKVSFSAFNGTEIAAMTSTDDSIVSGGIYTFTVGTNGVVSKAEAVSGAKGFVTHAEDKTLQLRGANNVDPTFYTYNEKTVVTSINFAQKTAETNLTVEDLDIYTTEDLALMELGSYKVLVIADANNLITNIYTFSAIQK